MRKFIILSIILFQSVISAQILPTNEWISFYSSNSLYNGESLNVGDIIRVYDNDNIQCGEFIVHTEGTYGYLNVYRDDFTTPGIDEGADPGDTLTFTINGNSAIVKSSYQPIWTSFGDILELDIESYGNWHPVISSIPNQIINEGGKFSAITLDNYVEDVDNQDSEISWTYSGNKELKVNINSDRVAMIEVPDTNWYGSEIITFIGTDLGGLSGSTDVTFTVNPINDAPVITSFAVTTATQGQLYQYQLVVEDVENDQIIYELTNKPGFLRISDSGLISGTPQNEDVGEHAVEVLVSDDKGGKNTQIYTLTVQNQNDPPIVSDIPDQIINEGGKFSAITLDNYVEDVDNQDSEISWTYSGNKELKVNINSDRVAMIEVPDTNWYGSEIITFIGTDPGGLSGSMEVTFTVNPVNDAPVLIDLPTEISFRSDSSYFLALKDKIFDVDNDLNQLVVEISINSDSVFTHYEIDSMMLQINCFLNFGGELDLIIKVIDKEGAFDEKKILVKIENVTGVRENNEKPKEYTLSQNYPNPFNPTTVFRFEIPKESNVSLNIYSITGELIGRIIESQTLSSGYYEYTWDATNFTSGIYVYTLKAGNFVDVKKMILMK